MSLLALQRDFRTWLTTQSPEAASRLGRGAAPGLSIYLNNYRSSLMACLGESFAATHAWLGDEAFTAAAANHIDRLPPHGWTLDAYALDFPATLADRYPNDPEVADLARIELALGLAFVGPDADPIDRASLADADWDTATLCFIPTLGVLGVSSNAAAIWSAITAGQPPPPAEILPDTATVIVWRSGFMPCFRTLAPDEHDALSQMIGGVGFGAVCARLVDQFGEATGPQMAGVFLGQWLHDGIVSSVQSRLCAP